MNEMPAGRIEISQTLDSLEAVFSHRGWLSDAPPELRTWLLSQAHAVELAKGERLFARGDSPGGIYGVISGGIGLEASARGHPLRIGHIVRRGAWFGEGPVLLGAERYLGALAVEDSVVLHLPLVVLQTAMQHEPEMQGLLGKLSQSNTIVTAWVACDLLIPEAPRRIAAVLLRVTGVLDGVTPQNNHGFPLNQALIGELANASRVHVNRVLRQLTEMGFITKHYNHLNVIDPEGLSRFAYSED
jgi:CRP/FNR family transcriptional regulator, cyclic AMP receptor protein